MVDAGGEGGFLAEVARQVDDAEAPVGTAAMEQARERVVARAVVHEDDLEAGCRRAPAEAPRVSRKRSIVLLFVEHRYDQRQQRIGRPARPLGGKLVLQRRVLVDGAEGEGLLGHERSRGKR